LIYVLKALFIIDCLFLVLVILLQSGKGGDVAAAFGGAGSQTAFGPRGAQKPLEKATIVSATIFMVLALLFSLPGFNGPSSVVSERSGGLVPPPAPAASVPTASPSPSAAASPGASSSPQASPSASASVQPSATPAKK